MRVSSVSIRTISIAITRRRIKHILPVGEGAAGGVDLLEVLGLGPVGDMGLVKLSTAHGEVFLVAVGLDFWVYEGRL